MHPKYSARINSWSPSKLIATGSMKISTRRFRPFSKWNKMAGSLRLTLQHTLSTSITPWIVVSNRRIHLLARKSIQLWFTSLIRRVQASSMFTGTLYFHRTTVITTHLLILARPNNWRWGKDRSSCPRSTSGIRTWKLPRQCSLWTTYPRSNQLPARTAASLAPKSVWTPTQRYQWLTPPSKTLQLKNIRFQRNFRLTGRNSESKEKCPIWRGPASLFLSLKWSSRNTPSFWTHRSPTIICEWILPLL